MRSGKSFCTRIVISLLCIALLTLMLPAAPAHAEAYTYTVTTPTTTIYYGDKITFALCFTGPNLIAVESKADWDCNAFHGPPYPYFGFETSKEDGVPTMTFRPKFWAVAPGTYTFTFTPTLLYAAIDDGTGYVKTRIDPLPPPVTITVTVLEKEIPEPTPTPTPAATPTSTPTASPSNTATPAPSPSNTVTSTPQPPVQTPVPTAVQTPTLTPTPSASPQATEVSVTPTPDAPTQTAAALTVTTPTPSPPSAPTPSTQAQVSNPPPQQGNTVIWISLLIFSIVLVLAALLIIGIFRKRKQAHLLRTQHATSPSRDDPAYFR